MKIELRLNDDTIIVPKQIEIEGYHIIGKDDKVIITLAGDISQNEYDEIMKLLEKFAITAESGFLLLTSGNKVTVLRRDE